MLNGPRWNVNEQKFEVRKKKGFQVGGLTSDRPTLRSSGGLSDLRTWRWSLALLRYSQTAPPCFESLKVSSSPASFHVRNWSPTDTPIDDGSGTPGKQRKLWGLVKVMATKMGSAHEKVTFPWDRWKSGGGERERGVITARRETQRAQIHSRTEWWCPDSEISSASFHKDLELITIMITARLSKYKKTKLKAAKSPTAF